MQICGWVSAEVETPERLPEGVIGDGSQMLGELASRRLRSLCFWVLVVTVAGLVGKKHSPGVGQEPAPAMRLDNKFSINVYWRGMRIPRK
jgi:hypothetical protein